MPTTRSLSAREARWLAIDAQGLARPRRGEEVGPADIESMVASLGAVQIDAINVLERTHLLAVFSRLGAYDRDLLHELTGPGGSLWEYWGHAASLMPVTDEPLFRWRYEVGGGHVHGPKVQARVAAWRAEHARYLDELMDEVRERGPLPASGLNDPRPREGEWWGRRSLGRQALDHLHGRGQLVAWRTPGFEVVYDLPERALPAEVLRRETPSAQEARRMLLLKAARAYGVSTPGDLAGYYKFKASWARELVDDLVDQGDLEPVTVEGWSEPGLVPADARAESPARDHATIVSPFDSLVWDRARLSRLFDFDYRIEVYVPKAKRTYGYFVLPVLLGDRLVARLDLKADRDKVALRVVGAFGEPGVDMREVAGPVGAELEAMAAWLGLGRVVVGRKGDLSAPLRSAL